MRKLFGNKCYAAAEYALGFREARSLIPKCDHQFQPSHLSNSDLDANLQLISSFTLFSDSECIRKQKSQRILELFEDLDNKYNSPSIVDTVSILINLSPYTDANRQQDTSCGETAEYVVPGSDQEYARIITFQRSFSQALQFQKLAYQQQVTSLIQNCGIYESGNLSIIQSVGQEIQRDYQARFEILQKRLLVTSDPACLNFFKQIYIDELKQSVLTALASVQKDFANANESTLQYQPALVDQTYKKIKELTQISCRSDTLKLINYQVLTIFQNFYTKNAELRPDLIRQQIRQSFGMFGDYQTYKTVLRHQNLVLFRKNTLEYTVTTPEEYRKYQELQLKNHLKIAARHFIQFSTDSWESFNNNVQIGFDEEKLKDLVEVQSGFLVEKEFLLQLLDEAKQETIQNLQMDEKQFEGLLRQRGGRLYQLYMQSKQNAQQGVHEDQQRAEDPLELKDPKLSQVQTNNTQAVHQKKVTFTNNSEQSLQQFQQAEIERSIARSNMSQEQFASHLHSSLYQRSVTQRTEGEALQCPELTNDFFVSAPQYVEQIYCKPLVFMKECFEYSIIELLRTQHSIECLQDVVFDYYFLQNTMIELDDDNILLPQLDPVIRYLLLEQNDNANLKQLQSARAYLVRLQKLLNKLSSIQCQLNSIKSEDSRHRRVCGVVFVLKQTFQTVVQHILYQISEECQRFMVNCSPDNDNLTLQLLIDQFDNLIVRSSELTAKDNIYVIDGCDFLASQIQEYIQACGMNQAQFDLQIHDNEVELVKTLLNIIRNAMRIKLEVERAWTFE